jgi:phosphotransferase system enzyme I (PtsI)
MEIKRGIAVSPGVAIGPAFVLQTEWHRLPRRVLEPSRREAEVGRLREALGAAAAEARRHQQAVTSQLGAQYGAIFGAHALLLEDDGLRQEVEAQVRRQGFSAEYALSRVLRRYAQTLEGLQGGHFAARAADLLDIEKRVLENLLGQRREQVRHLDAPAIVLAHDLTPSETASLDTRHVRAFATEAGGRASHTAIVAGVLGLPAVVGVGPFVEDLASGDLVVVDGNRGLLILRPDEGTLKEYQRELQSYQRFEHGLEALRDLPAETRDGVRVSLQGNIEFPEEARECVQRGAEGVGLYRTEFLYLNRTTDPTEEEHYQAYRKVVQTLAPRPVVIRTLDLGADKFASPTQAAPAERNPFLGLRSLRLCLRNIDLFKTQIRAILRASAHGAVRIMFPMVSTLLELRQSKMILAEVKEDLEDEGVPFNPGIPVGTMIEVPSAALLADLLAQEADFFSIGTNDLIQYTLAADRTNEEVAGLYNAGDPAVLRLIDQVCQASRRRGIGLNVCGQMAAEPMYAVLLLGMGLRQLSVTPHSIPEVKKVIRSVAIPEAEEIAREVMRMETARDVNNYLRERTHRIVPHYEEA